MDQASFDTLPAEIIKTHGQLDILVNNAGISIQGEITEASGRDFAHNSDRFRGPLSPIPASNWDCGERRG